MIDNMWAHWQGEDDADLADHYDVPQRKYPDMGVGDAWNQGFEHKNIVDDKAKTIKKGTPRDFKAEDWMTFFGESDGFGPHAKLGYTTGPAFFGPTYLGFNPTKRKEFWKVQDLLNMRHSFRTFQYYDRAVLAAVTAPPPRPT
jgi:hypothetical protein